MGKTFRRGGSERGNYSFGKSIRDKRQRGQNRSTTQGNYYESKWKERPKKSIEYDEDGWQ